MEERRKFSRHPIKVPIRLRMGETESCLLKSESADLSEGGLCFYWPHGLAKGTWIEVFIAFGGERFDLTGRVAYSVQNQNDGFFRTGVEFQDPPMDFRRSLVEEMKKIKAYCGELRRRLGREVSLEEAASEWMKRYAEQFIELYR